MDKGLRSFLLYSTMIILAVLASLCAFSFIYSYSSIDIYSAIILFLIALTIIILLGFISAAIAVYCEYRSKSTNRALRKLASAAVRVILPGILSVSGLFKGSRDSIRSFYIQMSNMLVRASNRKYSPGKVLVLLPHCLQSSKCGYKITGNINNCRSCGNCCIGRIKKLVDEKGVNAIVVTGGTVARSLVAKYDPELVISVACERDLAAGMMDVRGKPVLGLVNRRPNGPCIDTAVDVDQLELALEQMLE